MIKLNRYFAFFATTAVAGIGVLAGVFLNGGSENIEDSLIPIAITADSNFYLGDDSSTLNEDTDSPAVDNIEEQDEIKDVSDKVETTTIVEPTVVIPQPNKLTNTDQTKEPVITKPPKKNSDYPESTMAKTWSENLIEEGASDEWIAKGESIWDEYEQYKDDEAVYFRSTHFQEFWKSAREQIKNLKDSSQVGQVMGDLLKKTCVEKYGESSGSSYSGDVWTWCQRQKTNSQYSTGSLAKEWSDNLIEEKSLKEWKQKAKDIYEQNKDSVTEYNYHSYFKSYYFQIFWLDLIRRPKPVDSTYLQKYASIQLKRACLAGYSSSSRYGTYERDDVWQWCQKPTTSTR